MLRSLSSVQDVPSQISVFAVSGVLPPKDKAAVAVPVVIKSLLPEFRSLTSVQELPSHDSALASVPEPGLKPPAISAEELVSPAV